MKRLICNPYFIVTALLQVAGPYFFSFGNWANIIQYISAFGMAYGLREYVTSHKKQINQLKSELEHLHLKHDAMHEMIKGGMRSGVSN